MVFLTRLPLRLGDGSDMAALASAMPWFPIVGAGIGLAGGLVYALALLALPPWPAAVLALAAMILLTGALHEDGLADALDGLGGRDREQRLEIMRDSRLGTYGALGLGLALLARAGALAALATPLAALSGLIAASALSRAALPMVMAFDRPARADGLGAAAGRPHPAHAAAAAIVGVLLAFLALPPIAALVAVGVAGAAALAAAFALNRAFGGYTGDTLGAVQQVAEIAALLAVVAMRELPA